MILKDYWIKYNTRLNNCLIVVTYFVALHMWYFVSILVRYCESLLFLVHCLRKNAFISPAHQSSDLLI